MDSRRGRPCRARTRSRRTSRSPACRCRSTSRTQPATSSSASSSARCSSRRCSARRCARTSRGGPREPSSRRSRSPPCSPARLRARARRGGLARRGLPARGTEPRRRLRRRREARRPRRCTRRGPVSASPGRASGAAARSPATCDGRRATVRGVGDVERTILALRACGSGTTVGGRDLLADLRRAQRGDGSWSGLVNATAFGVLALRAAGVPRSSGSLSKALRWVTARQHADGGFSFPGRAGRSDIDVTSGVVQALAAVRGRDIGRAGRRAVAFLRGQQRPDGGFPLPPAARRTRRARPSRSRRSSRPGSVRAPSAGTGRGPPRATSAASRPPTARCGTRARRRRRRCG